MTNNDEQEALARKRYRRQREMRRRRRMRRRKVELAATGVMCLLIILLISLITAKYSEREREALDQAKRAAQAGGGTTQNQALAVSGALVMSPSIWKEDAVCRIGSAGDVMVHMSLNEAYGGEKGEQHDFSPALATCRVAYESVDYMVVNLETSLAGADKPYSGFPKFNAPDSIVADLKNQGIDMQLLANNHMYDNGREGFFHTLDVCKAAGTDYAGARSSESEPRYTIVDLNGIRVGFINYTFEMESKGSEKSINGNVMEKDMQNLLNSFNTENLESFYTELRAVQQELYMRETEFVILYIHWGNGYELEPNSMQRQIAANVCEMGIDVLIGSHPHVVQPIEVLTNRNGTHKMLCAYSLGNHLTDQRRDKISSRPNGHTEDGLILNLTLARTSGVLKISGIEALPTYVYKNGGQFYVIPIFSVETVEEQTGLSDIRSTIQASYQRTWNILGNSLETARRELGILTE